MKKLEAVHDWLDEVGLRQYEAILLENEFDSLEAIAEISEADLIEMDIRKVGAKRKFLSAVRTLNLAVQAHEPIAIRSKRVERLLCARPATAMGGPRDSPAHYPPRPATAEPWAQNESEDDYPNPQPPIEAFMNDLLDNPAPKPAATAKPLEAKGAAYPYYGIREGKEQALIQLQGTARKLILDSEASARSDISTGFAKFPKLRPKVAPQTKSNQAHGEWGSTVDDLLGSETERTPAHSHDELDDKVGVRLPPNSVAVSKEWLEEHERTKTELQEVKRQQCRLAQELDQVSMKRSQQEQELEELRIREKEKEAAIAELLAGKPPPPTAHAPQEKLAMIKPTHFDEKDEAYYLFPEALSPMKTLTEEDQDFIRHQAVMEHRKKLLDEMLLANNDLERCVEDASELLDEERQGLEGDAVFQRFTSPAEIIVHCGIESESLRGLQTGIKGGFVLDEDGKMIRVDDIQKHHESARGKDMLITARGFNKDSARLQQIMETARVSTARNPMLSARYPRKSSVAQLKPSITPPLSAHSAISSEDSGTPRSLSPERNTSVVSCTPGRVPKSSSVTFSPELPPAPVPSLPPAIAIVKPPPLSFPVPAISKMSSITGVLSHETSNKLLGSNKKSTRRPKRINLTKPQYDSVLREQQAQIDRIEDERKQYEEMLQNYLAQMAALFKKAELDPVINPFSNPVERMLKSELAQLVGLDTSRKMLAEAVEAEKALEEDSEHLDQLMEALNNPPAVLTARPHH